MDEKLKMLMDKLGISETEAQDIVECDKKIDKGEKLFELTDEQKKVEKKSRSAGRKPTVYQFSTRKRKSDNNKADIINLIAETLSPQVEKLDVTNPEREIEFVMNDRKFKIVLSAPRK